MAHIFKIVPEDLWRKALKDGRFAGAPVDLQDGFIHFSAAHQVRETARRHFAGQTDLLLVAVEAGSLGDSLKWEVSRGGDRFPHLFGELDPALALSVAPLPLNDDGFHQFPADIT